MNLIKSALTALTATVLTVSPSFARVERGTANLIRLMNNRGINVVINPRDCRPKVHGYYRTDTTTLAVCSKGTADAEAHDTVRHEAIHAIQHCVAERLNRRGLHTIIRDKAKYKEFITSSLSPEFIQEIMRVYPRGHWAVELEAFAASTSLTANQIGKIFIRECGAIRA